MLSELVNVTGLAARTSITIAHTIGLTPDLVLPDRATAIGCTSCSPASATFYNYGDGAASAVFVLHRMHSVQGQVSPAPLLWSGGLIVGALWGANATQTVANTDVETTMLAAAGIGSKVLPAGFWYPGKYLNWTTRGVVTALNGQTSRLRIKLDGVDLINSLGTLPNGLAGNYAEIVFDMVCRSVDAVAGTASILGAGRSLFSIGAGIAGSQLRPLVMAVAADVPNNVPVSFDATYQWTLADPGNDLTWYMSALHPVT